MKKKKKKKTGTKQSSINGIDFAGIYTVYFYIFFQGFLSRALTTHSTVGEGRGPFLFHSTTSTVHKNWDIYLQLCMWDGSHIFNCIACICQTATWWDLPFYRITIWLIDDVMLFIYFLFTRWFDSRFLLQQFDKRNWREQICIEFHPCITSEPTKVY